MSVPAIARFASCRTVAVKREVRRIDCARELPPPAWIEGMKVERELGKLRRPGPVISHER